MIASRTSYGAKPLYDRNGFEKKFNAVFQGIGGEVAQAVTPYAQQVYRPPGAVVYPIQWASDKQRRAFFASDGFGRGIPTERRGKVNQGWKVRWRSKNPSTGFLELYNTVSYARFVYGGFSIRTMNQQPFHRNTGWITGVQGRDTTFREADRLIRVKYDEALGGFGPLLGGKR